MTDFTIKHGTDFRRDFRCKDSTGGLVDLTGYSAEWHAIFGSTEIVKTAADLFDAADQALGMMHLHLTPTETRMVPFGCLMQWALELRAPGDTPPGSGDQIIAPDLTGHLEGVEGIDNVD